MRRADLKVGEAYAVSSDRRSTSARRCVLVSTEPPRYYSHSRDVRMSNAHGYQEWVPLGHIKMSWDEYLLAKEWADAVSEQRQRKLADQVRSSADPDVIAQVEAIKEVLPLSSYQERLLLQDLPINLRRQGLIDLINAIQEQSS